MYEIYSHLIRFKEGTTNSVKYRNLTRSIGSMRGRGKEKGGEAKREGRRSWGKGQQKGKVTERREGRLREVVVKN